MMRYQHSMNTANINDALLKSACQNTHAYYLYLMQQLLLKKIRNKLYYIINRNRQYNNIIN
jgi:hypothetical protein